MELWFCSDHHLGHENIIKFCDRPFTNVTEMDEKLKEWHNAFVKPEDHVYFLGDVTLKRSKQQEAGFIQEMKKWNGHKRLILGNHDHFPIKVYLEAGFEKIYGTWRGIDDLLLSHIPIHPASMGTASANIFGHIHNAQSGAFTPVLVKDLVTQKLKIRPYINVCVEVINYHPITLSQVKELVQKAIDGENTRIQAESESSSSKSESIFD